MNSTQLSFPLTIECGTCKCCDADGVKLRYNFGMFWYMCDKCLGINNTSKPKQINPQKIAAALAALEEKEECVKIREDGLGCICAVCFGKNIGKWDGECYWVGVGEQKPANHPYP